MRGRQSRDRSRENSQERRRGKSLEGRGKSRERIGRRGSSTDQEKGRDSRKTKGCENSEERSLDRRRGNSLERADSEEEPDGRSHRKSKRRDSSERRESSRERRHHRENSSTKRKKSPSKGSDSEDEKDRKSKKQQDTKEKRQEQDDVNKVIEEEMEVPKDDKILETLVERTETDDRSSLVEEEKKEEKADTGSTEAVVKEDKPIMETTEISEREEMTRDPSVKVDLNEELFMDIFGDAKTDSLNEERTPEEAGCINSGENATMSAETSMRDEHKGDVETGVGREDGNSSESNRGKFISSFATASPQFPPSATATKIPILRIPVALTIDSKLGKTLPKSFASKEVEKEKSGVSIKCVNDVERGFLSPINFQTTLKPEAGPNDHKAQVVSNLKLQKRSEDSLHEAVKNTQVHLIGDKPREQPDDITEVAMDISDDSMDAVRSEDSIPSSPEREIESLDATNDEQAKEEVENQSEISGNEEEMGVVSTPQEDGATSPKDPVRTEGGAEEEEEENSSDEDDAPPPPPPPAPTRPTEMVLSFEASDKYSPDSPTEEDDRSSLVVNEGRFTGGRNFGTVTSSDISYAFGFEQLLEEEGATFTRQLPSQSASDRIEVEKVDTDLRDTKGMPDLRTRAESEKIVNANRAQEMVSNNENFTDKEKKEVDNQDIIDQDVDIGVSASVEEDKVTDRITPNEQSQESEIVEGKEEVVGLLNEVVHHDSENATTVGSSEGVPAAVNITSGFGGCEDVVESTSPKDEEQENEASVAIRKEQDEGGLTENRYEEKDVKMEEERQGDDKGEKQNRGPVLDESSQGGPEQMPANSPDLAVPPEMEIAPEIKPEEMETDSEDRDAGRQAVEEAEVKQEEEEEEYKISSPTSSSEIPEIDQRPLPLEPIDSVIPESTTPDSPPELQLVSVGDMEVDGPLSEVVPVLERETSSGVTVPEIPKLEDTRGPAVETVKEKSDITSGEEIKQRDGLVTEEGTEEIESGSFTGEDVSSAIPVEGQKENKEDKLGESSGQEVQTEGKEPVQTSLEPGEILDPKEGEKDSKAKEEREKEEREKDDRRQRDRDRRERRSEREREREVERKANFKEWGIVEKENYPPFEKLTENYYQTER